MQASLWDAGGYGTGLRKFHLFCDIFSIPESACLPASFELLHSFAIWAVTDPKELSPSLSMKCPFEPVSIDAIRKYLSGVRAWHIAQGWPKQLLESNCDRVQWSLQGLRNMFGNRKCPLRPPFTIPMLWALKTLLNLEDPFEACIWAMASCAYWGMMRFGEVSVHSRASFVGMKHLKHADVLFDRDLNGMCYARLDLPAAKTAATGKIQSVFLVKQQGLCPLKALENIARVVPAGPNDPLFHGWTEEVMSIPWSRTQPWRKSMLSSCHMDRE